MKKNHALPLLIAGALLGALTTAHADEYQFRHYISGLKPAPASVPEEPTEPEVTWELTSATLLDATVGKAYNYSFYDLVTPASLDGFQWAGSGLPTWASLDWSTGELTGTPSKSDVGEKSFAITASREGVNGQQIYTIQVAGQYLEVTQIGSGEYYNCALTTDSAVKCWGEGRYGQLGNGSFTNSSTPVSVLGLSAGVTTLSTGQRHACALTSSGAAKCWGNNSTGALGDGTQNNSAKPVSVTGLTSGVTSISAGYYQTCAITAGASVKCWGTGSLGQLGNGSNTSSFTPTSVSGLNSGVIQISSGNAHVCALVTGGAVKCWGYNLYGQVGSGETSTSVKTPVTVTGLSSGVAAISSGGYQTCAITTGGAAKCWGYNTYGQLGNGATTNSYTPVSVSGLSSGVKSIAGGGYHFCAITTGGAAKCWGYNSHGQLGNAGTADSALPVTASVLGSNVTSISTGSYHTCAITTDNTAKCWGRNDRGQLGDATTTNSLTPVHVLAN